MHNKEVTVNHHKKIRNTILLGLIMILGCAFSAYGLEETGGIGMKVAQLYDYIRDDHRGSIVVLDVFPKSPAEEAGIQRGDILTHIDGKLTRGKDFEKVLQEDLRGDEGSEIKIKVWRSSSKQRLEMTLIRVPMVY